MAEFKYQNIVDEIIRAIAPGTMFSFDKRYESYFRITFALPWNDTVQQGIVRLTEVINDYLIEHQYSS